MWLDGYMWSTLDIECLVVSWSHSHAVATHCMLQVVVDPHTCMVVGVKCRGGKASCLFVVGVLQLELHISWLHVVDWSYMYMKHVSAQRCTVHCVHPLPYCTRYHPIRLVKGRSWWRLCLPWRGSCSQPSSFSVSTYISHCVCPVFVLGESVYMWLDGYMWSTLDIECLVVSAGLSIWRSILHHMLRPGWDGKMTCLSKYSSCKSLTKIPYKDCLPCFSIIVVNSIPASNTLCAKE